MARANRCGCRSRTSRISLGLWRTRWGCRRRAEVVPVRLSPERVAEQGAVETRAGITGGCESEQRGGIDSLQRRLSQGKQDEGGHEHRGYDHRENPALNMDQARDRGDAECDQREIRQAEYQAHADAADDVFAPGLLEQRGAFLDGIDRADVARDQQRHDEEGGQRKRHAEKSDDPSADDPQPSAIMRSTIPTVAAIAAYPRIAPNFEFAMRKPSDTVGSPPSRRIMAAPTSAALK